MSMSGEEDGTEVMASSIRLSFHHGACGIVLHPDGTATTWGGYDPKEAAAEFIRCALAVYKLSVPKGSA